MLENKLKYGVLLTFLFFLWKRFFGAEEKKTHQNDHDIESK